MKKLIKRIFRGKYYKNGESYVDTIVKVIICVVVGALLLTACSPAAKSGLESAEKSGLESAEKSGLESAKNKVNDLFDYNPDGEGGGGGDTSIPGGGDESAYLTFQSVNPFTIRVAFPRWDGTMEYSTDTKNWATWNGSSISSVDGKVYLRGTGNTRFSAESYWPYSPFVISGTDVECVGNIETLLDWQKVLNGEQPTMDSYCFAYAFFNNSALISAPALPVTTLADYCYYRMFYGCTSLTTVPALPATTLAEGCYYEMFYICTSLTTAPALPATTLANKCYYGMFYCCTNLTTAPALPATTLADYCYYHMFSKCSSLTTAPELPATTLANSCYEAMFWGCTNLKVSATQTGTYQHEWRIPTEGTISSTKNDWNAGMFASTGGTFKGNPAINTTYYLEYPPVG